MQENLCATPSETPGRSATPRFPSSPTVFIGLVTYRRPKQLQLTVQSLLEQTFKDFIIYIADDASGDETPDIVAKLQATDSRIHFHQHPKNIGAVANFQHVLDVANSPYFLWMSDDDLTEPEFLSVLVQELENDPDVNLTFCDYRLIDFQYRERGHVSLAPVRPDAPWAEGQLDFWSYPYAECMNVISGLYRTEALRQVREPFTNTRKRLISGHEATLLAQIAMRGRIVAVAETLFTRMGHWDDKDSLGHHASRGLRRRDLLALYAAIYRRLFVYALKAQAPARQRIRLLIRLASSMRRKASEYMARRPSKKPLELDNPTDVAVHEQSK